MIKVSSCGAGDLRDPEHLKVCMMCNELAWREHRATNSRFLRWLDRIFDGLPIPPDCDHEKVADLVKVETPPEAPQAAEVSAPSPVVIP